MTKERALQLRQLDALAHVGLLRKRKTSVNVHGSAREAVRYSLSDAGWAASDYDIYRACLQYGKLRYLGVSQFLARAVENKAGVDVYEVRAKVGLASEAELAAWARDPSVQDAFPDIKKSLQAQDFTVLLVRGSGDWIEYQSLLQGDKQGQRPERVDYSQVAPLASDEEKRRRERADIRPPPTVEDVKRVIQDHFGGINYSRWPHACLNLPRRSKLPVDHDFTKDAPSRYLIAIDPNKSRRSNDEVALRTIPYLNELESLGVLRKRRTHGEDPVATYDGYLYELTEAYRGRVDPNYAECFPLGVPTIHFIDVQLSDKNREGYTYHSVRFKLRQVYRSAPAWMRNPALIQKWSQLKGVIEEGRACQGEFGFNLEERRLEAGAGSCWWAFETIEAS